MIDEIIRRCGFPVIGGFVANRNANMTDCVDPMTLYRESIAVLIGADGTVYLAPVDATTTLDDQPPLAFRPANGLRPEKRIGFLWRTAGFAFRAGEFSGAYLISPDLLQTPQFPKSKDYVNYLMQHS